MQALVTGSTGFLGSHICRVLLEAGHEVSAFHRTTSRLTLLEGMDIEHAVGDLTQPETILAAMQGVDAVFHAAAKVGYWRDSQGMMDVTVGGTRHVLEAAAKTGVKRVVHVSSVAALGVPEDVHRMPGMKPGLLDENHAWNYSPSKWQYGYAKHLAEREVQRAVAKGLDVVIVNPAAIYGAGDINRISGDLIVQVVKRRLPVVVPGGMNVVHVRDVAEGVLAAFHKGKRGERYILGGENLSLMDLVKVVAGVTGVEPPKYLAPVWLTRRLAAPVDFLRRLVPVPINGELLRFAGLYFYYDTGKAETQLELRDKRSVYQAIQDTYDWYRKQGVI